MAPSGTPAVEQDILLAKPDQRGRRHAARVRAWAAGAEQYDFHGAYSSVKPVDLITPPQRV
jgi:hypothetical protein